MSNAVAKTKEEALLSHHEINNYVEKCKIPESLVVTLIRHFQSMQWLAAKQWLLQLLNAFQLLAPPIKKLLWQALESH